MAASETSILDGSAADAPLIASSALCEARAEDPGPQTMPPSRPQRMDHELKAERGPASPEPAPPDTRAETPADGSAAGDDPALRTAS